MGATVFNGDSIAVLMSIYMNQDLPLSVRLEAASIAAPFERPRLSAIAVGDVGKQQVTRIVFAAGDEKI